MFLHVCKQTFCKLSRCITRQFLGLWMRNFLGIIFIWTRTYRDIFKSAFKTEVILKKVIFITGKVFGKLLFCNLILMIVNTNEIKSQFQALLEFRFEINSGPQSNLPRQHLLVWSQPLKYRNNVLSTLNILHNLL